MLRLKYAGWILGLLLIVVGGFFYSNQKVVIVETESLTNYPPKSETIVAFGDSLVVGVGSLETEGFVGILEERLEREILNFGVSGNTTEMALERVDEAITTDPGLAIILLGGNDYLRQIDKETTMNNLRKVISKFQSSGSVTLLLGVRGGFLKDNYESDYREVAQETGSAYVPNVLEGLIGEDELMYDRIHPNQKGYEIIANRVEPILKEIIN